MSWLSQLTYDITDNRSCVSSMLPFRHTCTHTHPFISKHHRSISIVKLIHARKRRYQMSMEIKGCLVCPPEELDRTPLVLKWCMCLLLTATRYEYTRK